MKTLILTVHPTIPKTAKTPFSGGNLFTIFTLVLLVGVNQVWEFGLSRIKQDC